MDPALFRHMSEDVKRSRGPPLSIPEAAHRPNTLQNVWAVVIECSAPRVTRKDLMVSLKIMDPPSYHDAAFPEGVDLLCFAPNKVSLPAVQQAGDIIRLHRVQINRFNDRPQFVASIRPLGPFAFLLFSATGDSEEPYQSSSPNHTFTDHDRRVLAALRQFSQAARPAVMQLDSQYLRRIRDMRPGHFPDVICKVLAVDCSSSSHATLFVWDGTDALPLPLSADTRPLGDLEERQDGNGGYDGNRDSMLATRQYQRLPLPLQEVRNREDQWKSVYNTASVGVSGGMECTAGPGATCSQAARQCDYAWKSVRNRLLCSRVNA